MSEAVLVIKLGALGDMIQALDSFHDIRAHHRDARITLLTTPPFAGLTARMPWFDAIWPDGRPDASDTSALFRLVARLRRERFGRAYDLQCNHRTALYRRLLVGPHRPQWIGTPRGAGGRAAAAPRHNSDAMRAQLAAADVPPRRPTNLVWLDGDVSALGLPPRFVMLVPGCSPAQPEKRWPAAKYAELGRRLRARGLDIVVTGTDADREVTAPLVAAIPDAVDLTWRTDLFQLATVARRAAGVVGNDTGPIFLSAAVGAPTLTLMSRHTDPARSAPRGAKTAWLRRGDLAALTVDEVMAAVLLQ